jgi:hypothetical protein
MGVGLGRRRGRSAQPRLREGRPAPRQQDPGRPTRPAGTGSRFDSRDPRRPRDSARNPGIPSLLDRQRGSMPPPRRPALADMKATVVPRSRAEGRSAPVTGRTINPNTVSAWWFRSGTRGWRTSPGDPPIAGRSAGDGADVRVAASEANASESTRGGSGRAAGGTAVRCVGGLDLGGIHLGERSARSRPGCVRAESPPRLRVDG